MIRIPGFTIQRELFNDGTLVGYVAEDKAGDLFLLKTTQSALPSESLISRLEYEGEVLSALPEDLFIRFYGLRMNENRPVLIFNFRESLSLYDYVKERPNLGKEEFIQIAQNIIHQLISIHEKDIIHKGLSPRSLFLFNKNNIIITDFGFAEFYTGLNRSIIEEYSPGAQYSYMSPESLGAYNLSLGFSSDYYSLGAVLYFLIKKKDPFISFSTKHLTEFLLNVDQRFTEKEKDLWGEALLSIVNKLLSLRSFDRYSSLQGVLYDLETVRNNPDITRFLPGTRDIPRRFVIPEYFMGNRDELEILHRMVEKSFTSGEGSYALISGRAGTGKSLLGEELRWPVLKHNGFFIEGRFDPVSRNNPYSAILSAFNQLIYQLLNKSSEEQERWRNTLLEKMSDNLYVITQLIPQILKLTGPVEPPENIESMSNKTHFLKAVNVFVSLVASMDHPLVLVLDDIQWADDSSLSLILKSLEFDGDLPISIILCYREDVLDENESLSEFLKSIVDSSAPLVKLALGNMNENTLIHLLQRITGSSEEVLQPLAGIIERKTYGNPLFIRQFLRSLYREGTLYFDREEECWSWDLESIESKDIGDNVVEFLSSRIRRLPSEVKIFLQYAACLGRTFAIDIISEIMQVPVEESAVYIQEAMLHGLVSSAQGGYIKNIPRKYHFLHNRIQNTVYTGLSETESRSIHLRIADYFYQVYKQNKDTSVLYEMALHYNKGANLVEDIQEKLKILDINLEAGRKAKQSLAVETAMEFLQRAIHLLPEDSWNLHYNLTYNLYSEAAECSQLALAEKDMEYYCSIIQQKGRDVIDRIKAYEIRINYFQSRNQMKKSIEAGREAFREFNIIIPEKVSPLRVLFEYLLCTLTLPEKKYDKLLEMPVMTDSLAQARIKLTYLLGNSVYMESPMLMALLVFRAVRMTVKYGISPYAISSITGFGFLQIGVFNRLRAGVHIGTLAMEILNRLKDTSDTVRSLFYYSSFIHFHKYPLRETLGMYDQGYRNAMSRGDTEGAAMSLFLQVTHQFFLGDELVGVERSLLKNFPVMKQLKQQWYLRMNTYRLRAVYQLMGMHDDSVLTIEGRTLLSDEDYFKEFHNNQASNAIFHITELMVAYLEERTDKALEHARKAYALRSSVMASINIPFLYFFWGLSLFSRWQEKGKLSRKEKKELSTCCKMVRIMAENAPVNFLFMIKILDSCKQWNSGDIEEATGLFGESITLVRDSRSLFMKGIVNELFGIFLETTRNDDLYRSFIQDSYYAYQRWGCQIKVSRLVDRYSFLYEKQMFFKENNPAETPQKNMRNQGDEPVFFLLSELLKRSDAQRIVLIMKQDETWFIKAEQEKGVSRGIVFSDRTLLDETKPILPLSLAFYTANSGHSAVVNGKQSSLDFKDDPYLEGRDNYSMITLPISGAGKMGGFFYLESFQPGFIFSDEQIRHLTYFLAGSGYIIENGRFIHMESLSKEEKLKSRTESLSTGIKRASPVSVLYAEMILGDESLSHVDSLLNLIDPIIKQYSGVIDHFIGEGLVVYFYGEYSHALDASKDILESLKNWNRSRHSQGLSPVRMGIGINNTNPEDHTVLQYSVNTAYRIGAMTSLLGSSILMSGTFYHLLASYEKYPARKVDLLMPENSKKPLVIYEYILFLDDEKDNIKLETLDEFEKALTFFNQKDFESSIKLFQKIWHKNPQDRVASMYLTRSRFYRNNGVPPGWDGTESLKSY